MTDDPRPDSTAILLHRVRSGDEEARERLVARHLPVLRAWAHRRLPANARGMAIPMILCRSPSSER